MVFLCFLSLTGWLTGWLISLMVGFETFGWVGWVVGLFVLLIAELVGERRWTDLV